MEVTIIGKRKTFGDLETGDVFQSGNYVYMKIDEIYEIDMHISTEMQCLGRALDELSTSTNSGEGAHLTATSNANAATYNNLVSALQNSLDSYRLNAVRMDDGLLWYFKDEEEVICGKMEATFIAE